MASLFVHAMHLPYPQSCTLPLRLTFLVSLPLEEHDTCSGLALREKLNNRAVYVGEHDMLSLEKKVGEAVGTGLPRRT